MPKAINWPLPFRNEVIAEDTDQLRCAVRLGTLYYDNHYWVDGEEVLIRVNHKVIRKANIVGALKACPINDLGDQDFQALKTSIQSKEALVQFLANNYEQDVTPDSTVTVVYYRNQAIDPEIMDITDDPHM